MKKQKFTQQEIWDAMRSNVQKSKKTYTRKGKQKFNYNKNKKQNDEKD